MAKQTTPSTLLGAIKYFSDPDVALVFMAGLRWPNGVECPACEGTGHSFLKTRRVWKCKDCKKQFSVKVGTVFEQSPIGLDKWLPCIWMLANCNNGVSSYEISRALGVTQKTAWFMLHRIRMAMQTKTFAKIGGEVEVDETYIGGRAKFMHHDKRKRVIKGTGHVGKVAVLGMLERKKGRQHSTVRLTVVPGRNKNHLQGPIRDNVEPGSTVYTDALSSYNGLDRDFEHGVVDHSIEYVKGKIHTNGLENFWSLLKRTIGGTYVSVDPFHIFRYLDEQVFRFNARKATDGSRFVAVASAVFGKRLTYAELVGTAMP